MPNYSTLTQNIQAQIKQNGTKAITGQILQTQLLAMITSLGAGYQYMGVAALNTKPGTPDYKCFYIATAVGTYSNFGSPALTVSTGEVAIFYYDTAWHKAVTGAASKADVDALIQTVESEVSELGQKVDEKVNTADLPIILPELYETQFILRGYWGKNSGIFTPNANYRSTPIIPFTSGSIIAKGTRKASSFSNFNLHKADGTFLASIDLASSQMASFEVKFSNYVSTYPELGAISFNAGMNLTSYLIINGEQPIGKEISEITSGVDAQFNDVWEVVGYGFNRKGYVSNSGAFTTHATFRCTKLIPLSGASSIIAAYTMHNSSVPNAVYYNADGSFNSYVASWSNRQIVTIQSSDFPAGAAFVVFNTSGDFVVDAYVQVNGEYGLDKRVGQLISWAGKWGVCYGDSITAQGNDGVSGYVGKLNREIAFKNLYGRGVGGQTFVWNDLCWYSEVGTNGAYLDRYLYDSAGNRTNNVISANYTAEQVEYIESALGKTIEVHRGCLCSWDRIKGMIPSAMRQNINLIIIMGGTNDFVSGYALGSGMPEFSSANTTDTDWVNDSTYYTGGDYDVTTFAGAVMSTIMKFTRWCPNAVIVVATPWGNFDTSAKKQTENINGDNIAAFAGREQELANYMGVPSINTAGEAGVNAFNASAYFADSIHPNDAGAKLIAKVIIGNLRQIIDRII